MKRFACGDRVPVTFAIFAYNQEEYIEEAIEGAFRQTYEPLEIILSDDSSTDQTFRIIQKRASEYRGPHTIKVMQSAENKGFAAHINAVLGKSEGTIVSWAAGDDIADPRRTELLVRAILSGPNIVAAHSAIEEIDLRGNHVKLREHPAEVRNINSQEVIKNGRSVVTQSMAFRKEVFDSFGPLLKDLTNEGKAMAFRLTMSGSIKYIKEPLTKYRVGSGTSTYSGEDIAKNKYSEPLKINGWYLSAYRQMIADSNTRPSRVTKCQMRQLAEALEFHENIHSINEGLAYIRPVLRNLTLRPTDTRSLRAVTRRVMPRAIYARF